MTKFMIYNSTDEWKTDVILLNNDIIASDLLVSWSYQVILNSVNTRDSGNSTITLHGGYKLLAASPFVATFPETSLLVSLILYHMIP